MNYLVDPFAGELVEFSKAGGVNALKDLAAAGGTAAVTGGRQLAATGRRLASDRTNQKIAGAAVGGYTAGRLKKSAGKMPVLVSTKTVAMKPVGRHGNAGPDTQLIRRRKRHVGPEPGWERYSKQFEGGALIAKRGTPMSDMSRVGRQGRRLATV